MDGHGGPATVVPLTAPRPLTRADRVTWWIYGLLPAPRSPMARWSRALLVCAVVVPPTAPLTDVALCGAAGISVSVRPTTWIFAAAYAVAAVALALSGRFWQRMRRGSGDRRARRRDGAPWWRDRDWPAATTEQVMCSRSAIPVWTAAFISCAGAWTLLTLVDWSPTGKPIETMPPVVPLVLGAFGPVLGMIVRPRRNRRSVVVSWPSLPQFTGGRVAFHVGAVEPHGVRISNVRLVLRCIRERAYGPFGALRRAESAWRAEFVVPPDHHVGPESELRVEFDVPAEAPSTDLTAREAVFWELCVTGTAPLPFAKDTIVAEPVLVPIYAR